MGFAALTGVLVVAATVEPTVLEEAISAFKQRTGIAVRCSTPCPPWAQEGLQNFERAWEALPGPMRKLPAALTLQLRKEIAPFGMGDGSLKRPDWNADGTTFYVYSVGPTEERRASWRLNSLDDAERESLWRQRALVHAVMKRWDEARHFSDRSAWRRLSGWIYPFQRPFTWSEEALNTFEGPYSRSRGQTSSQLDLLTFAEEYFVPVESVHPDALAADDTVRCQEMSKTRVLTDLLLGTGLLLNDLPETHCPAFEKWSRLDRLEAIEVWLVASSGRRPESLFGHVLLYPRLRPDAWVEGPSFQTAIQIAAMTEGGDKGPLHLLRGIFGGYSTTLFTLSRRDFERETLDGDQRAVRRFELHLSPVERAKLMARVWELERRGYFNYQFFSENCSSVLVRLVESVLDENQSVRLPSIAFVTPTIALDGLANTPLLTKIDDLLPSGVLAEKAEEQRAALELKLQAGSPSLRRTFSNVRHSQPAVRAQAYSDLARLPMPEPEWYDWWRASVQIERYQLDRARSALLDLEVQTLRFSKAETSFADRVAARQAQFEQETKLAQNDMELDRAEAMRDRLANAPHRALNDEEKREKARLLSTVALFEQLTELHGNVVDSLARDRQPQTFTEQPGLQRHADAELLYPSGSFRAAAGAGISSRDGTLYPAIRLYGAGLLEQLGDQRVRGFQPTSEFRVLETDTLLAPTLGWPKTLESHFVLFGYRSIAREAPLFRQNVLANFGWGINLAGDYLPDRRLFARSRIDVDLLAPLDVSANAERHLALGLGVRGVAGWQHAGFSAGGGPRVSVEQRVPLGRHSANALRMYLSYAPEWLGGKDPFFWQEVKGALRADFFVRAFKKSALLRPELAMSLDTEGQGPRKVATFSLLVEPLR